MSQVGESSFFLKVVGALALAALGVEHVSAVFGQAASECNLEQSLLLQDTRLRENGRPVKSVLQVPNLVMRVHDLLVQHLFEADCKVASLGKRLSLVAGVFLSVSRNDLFSNFGSIVSTEDCL